MNAIESSQVDRVAIRRRDGRSRRRGAGLGRSSIELLGPCGVSAALHALVLMGLALWILPSLRSPGILLNSFLSAGEALDAEELAFESGLEADVSDPAADPWEMYSEPLPPELGELEMLSETLTSDVLAPSEAAFGGQQGASVALESGTLATAESVEGAVDRVTGQIRGYLGSGDLLVVWLFDASKSLVDDRQRIAVRLRTFLDGIAADRQSREGGTLQNVVVSFGSRMAQRVAPTQSHELVLEAIRELPVDPSGREAVFSAAERCAIKYGRPKSGEQVMLVIWTDESGDDTDKLQRVIEACRERDVRVSVVGPSAVLGADTGFHAYTDPKTQIEFQLPVKRGPDTSVPERLRMGYWYRTRFGRSSGRRRRRISLPSWLGGPNLQGINSGFSPYALTRLTLETGGAYTIFDRPEDRGPFELEAMRAYLPDYGPAEEYLEEIRRSPLRRAVYEAVQVTLTSARIGPPESKFFGKYEEVPPYRFLSYYFEPSEFRSRMRAARPRMQSQAAHTAKLVEQALAKVSRKGRIDEGLEDLYQAEPSPRWRAWYDLTRGRLLATSVRLEEYRLTWEATARLDFFLSTTNSAIFRNSEDLKSSDAYGRRGEEALRLLTRCVEENADTPWAYLAQRELDYSLGVEVIESSLTPEPLAPTVRRPNLPKF